MYIVTKDGGGVIDVGDEELRMFPLKMDAAITGIPRVKLSVIKDRAVQFYGVSGMTTGNVERTHATTSAEVVDDSDVERYLCEEAS